jgi:CRISPR-associated protein Csb1
MTTDAAASDTPITVTKELLETWANDPQGPVALHLRQRLRPVEEGEYAVIFPPTYADIGYNIDTLSDGTKVATIDSVGSQANRMEPLFKQQPYAALVPQIEVEIRREDCGQCEPCRQNVARTSSGGGKKEQCSDPRIVRWSLLDFAHRVADATVVASPDLAKLVLPTIVELDRSGDAGPLCLVAPTSLIFGFWNSRAKPAVKRPRLVRSVIRAWDVEPLYSAAQFNSVWKSLGDVQKAALEKYAKESKVKLSESGFADAPATFRKVSQGAAKQMTEFRGGSPNPERRVLGGVVAKGAIDRTVTVNLLALRALWGTLPENGGRRREASREIRLYLLLLALLAATADPELYLREGCLLQVVDDSDQWWAVPRRGKSKLCNFSSAVDRGGLLSLAKDTVKNLNLHWPKDREYVFDINAAKQLIKQAASAESEAS